MKIAFFVSEFPSLSQTFVLNQITGLLERGHDVDIFSRRRGNDSTIHEDVNKYGLLKRTHYFLKIPRNRLTRTAEGIALIAKYLPKNSAAILNSLNVYKHGKNSASLVLLYQTIPFLEKNTFDIIHCHFGPNGNIAVMLKEAGVISGKIVTVFHGYDVTSYLAKTNQHVYKKLFEQGDLFQPISKRWEKRLIDLGCDRNRISVHRMGIDFDKIQSPPNNPVKNNGVKKILSVARLVEKKGIEYGIYAISKVIKNFPNIEYLIVGDGPLKDELQNLIDRLHLGQKIKLMGWKNQEETFEIMQQSDIFIAPSVTSRTGDQEGIPVVLMEAMAHGLPVISTYHSGIPELVINNKTGLLVNEKDWEGLVQKIEFLITNPQQSKQFGNEGRRTVAAEYDIKILDNNLVKSFHSLLYY
jgi:colanic acid/amylovoran biosynthesis glycosyltransferase